jgi:hypothetical protein
MAERLRRLSRSAVPTLAKTASVGATSVIVDSERVGQPPVAQSVSQSQDYPVSSECS